MEQYNIIVDEHVIDQTLHGFDIFKKPSSNIEYYGTNGKDVFVQFQSGISYIYENVPQETSEEMQKAESIGSFIFKHLAKKFSFKKFESKLVNSKPQQ